MDNLEKSFITFDEKHDLRLMEDPMTNIDLRIFSISHYCSKLFHRNLNGKEPSEFEIHEAVIFACCYTLSILSVRKSKFVDDAYRGALGNLAKTNTVNIISKIVELKEFPNFYINRLNSHLKEAKKFQDSKFEYVIRKLYIDPLSSSFEFNIPKDQFLEYLKLKGLFIISLRHYAQTVDSILNKLKID